jgi:hypothetical protein
MSSSSNDVDLGLPADSLGQLTEIGHKKGHFLLFHPATDRQWSSKPVFNEPPSNSSNSIKSGI